MFDEATTIQDLRDRVEAFVRVREWEMFHNPKDLAAAISIEAAELMELFLWRDPEDVEKDLLAETTQQRIRDELADIVILCLSLANRLEVDLADAVFSKVRANEVKYPVEKARGKSLKYTHYEDGM